MKPKIHIGDAGNVYIPAYLALQQKGFTVSTWFTSNPEQEWWQAENETSCFTAHDVLSLLGIVAMYETRGEDWMASDDQIDAFIREFPEFF